MLVRCEHCGSALPDDATKCFVCGNRHTPLPPPEPEPIDPVLEQRKKKWLNLGWVIGLISVVIGLVGIIMFITGMVIMNESATIDAKTGLIIALIGLGCFVICILVFVFIVQYEKTLEPQPKDAKNKVDEAEYE